MKPGTIPGSRLSLKAAGTGWVLALLIVCYVIHVRATSQNPATPRRPNILLVISDDIGLDVTSNMYPGMVDELVRRYGPQGRNHPNYQAIHGRPASTPVLDTLARQGMAFTDVWAQPFCSPTRASILTGLFSAKTRVLSYTDPLSASHTSLAQILKDEGGYRTAVFGKWHMAGLTGSPVDYPGMKPKQAGFDLFKGNMHAAIRTYWDYDYQVQDALTPAGQWRTEAPPRRSLPGIAPTTYAPVVKAADAIEWIAAQEKAEPERPWFVWLAFNLAHATAQQKPSAMAIPEASTLDDASRKEVEACGGTFGSMNTGKCSGETLMRVMTNALDTILGKVLGAVDEIDPDTYVIYVGDNGTPMYGRPNLDFIDNLYLTKKGRGKGTTYESGIRVAMTIRGPGIAAASRSSEFAHVADVFSTSLELARLNASKTVASSDGSRAEAVDGVSLVPILFNKASRVRDPNEGYVTAETVNLMTGGTREVGARNRHYKVVCRNSSDNCQFFNLDTDPLEEFPLAVPGNCGGYQNGTRTPADAEWHYCRLTEVVKTKSFFLTAP